MPFCKEDYVEVFLTSSYRSIGKFCSNNAGKPFTMYSRDRYAKIIYSTNSYATGSGFTFTYRLKSSVLGGTTYSSTCYNTYNYASSGEIYSTGWPSNYQQSYSSCSFKIDKSPVYQGVYVVFMDINMYAYYSYNRDYVQLRGSNYSSYYYEKAISSTLYSTIYMKAYTTYNRYLKIEFERRYKQSSSYRGFVAGYIMFKKPTAITEDTGKTSTHTAGIVLGILIPLIIIIIIVVAVVVYTKKRKRYNQPQNANNTSATQQTTTQQTAPPASSMTYANFTASTPQYAYPTATMQNGAYASGSYSIAYTTGPSYSTGQFATPGNTYPQVSFMVTPAQNSIPVGAVQPSGVPGTQEQKPSGTLYHAPSTSLYYNANAPPPMPPIEASPNAPPPAYNAVTSS